MKLKRPKLRKVNTAKRKKERKAAEAALRRATSAMLDMPSGCCVCGFTLLFAFRGINLTKLRPFQFHVRSIG